MINEAGVFEVKRGMFLPILLVSATLLNGLFYNENLFFYVILLTAVTIILCIKTKKAAVQPFLTATLCLNLTLSVLLVGLGINQEEAVYRISRDILYLLTALSAVSFFGDEKNTVKTIDLVFDALSCTGLYCVFVNFSAACAGLMSIDTGFIRFGLVIPYPNTLALFFALGALWCLFKNGRVWRDVALFINLYGLLMTYSRAMWVVFFFAAAAALVLAGKGSFMRLVLSGVLAAAAAVVSGTAGFLAAGIFIVTAIILIVLKEKYKVLSLVIPAAAFLSAGVFFARSPFFVRISEITPSSSSFVERLMYYKDSLKIIRDYPLFGTGAGGWASVFPSYQSGFYAAKYVHSSILQKMLDSGAVGTLLALAVAVFYMYCYFKARKTNKNYADILFVINAAIVAHSLFDTDFEIPVTGLILYLNISAMAALSGTVKAINVKPLLKTALSVLLCASLVFNAVLYISTLFYLKGYSEFEAGNYENAEKNLRWSTAVFSGNASAYYLLGQTIRNGGGNYDEGISALDNAIKIDGKNPKYHAAKAHYAFEMHDISLAADTARALVALQPLTIGHYELLSDVLLLSGTPNDLKEAAEIPDLLKETEKRVSRKAYVLKPKMSLKPTEKILENKKTAERLLNSAAF